MAADNVVNLPGRGKTYLKGPNRTPDAAGTTSLAIEGIRKTFKDLDYSGVGIKAPRSGGEVVCTLVRNDSGITLLPKRAVSWKSGYIGKRVDGYCTLDYVNCAGIVDEWLNSTNGVADDDYFWIAQRGPSNCLTDLAGGATNVINAGDIIVALTAATSQATTAGRVQSFVATSNVTNAVSEAMNKLGRALSAKTTANTNASVLVYLELVA